MTNIPENLFKSVGKGGIRTWIKGYQCCGRGIYEVYNPLEVEPSLGFFAFVGRARERVGMRYRNQNAKLDSEEREDDDVR